MKKELHRLSRSERDSALKRALERQEAESWTPDPAKPLLWWNDWWEQRHHEWLQRHLTPVPFSSLRWTEKVVAGQPVWLETEGHQHLAWIRLEGLAFERWPASGVGGGIALSEVTFRDPRELWGDAYVLQLALALLAAHRDPADPGHGWLDGVWDDPGSECATLLEDALSELEPPTPEVLTQEKAPCLPAEGGLHAST